MGASISTQFAQHLCGDGGDRFLPSVPTSMALVTNAQRSKMRSNKRDELTTNSIADAVLDRQQERYLIDCWLLITASLARVPVDLGGHRVLAKL
jgi:hypothetical protein